MDLIAMAGVLTGTIIAGWLWLKRRKVDEQDAKFKRYVKTLDDKKP
jgi:hypothetical protein